MSPTHKGPVSRYAFAAREIVLARENDTLRKRAQAQAAQIIALRRALKASIARARRAEEKAAAFKQHEETSFCAPLSAAPPEMDKPEYGA